MAAATAEDAMLASLPLWPMYQYVVATCDSLIGGDDERLTW
jgi:hypothetical protein